MSLSDRGPHSARLFLKKVVRRYMMVADVGNERGQIFPAVIDPKPWGLIAKRLSTSASCRPQISSSMPTLGAVMYYLERV